jgi:hypothetical protein
MPRNSTRPEAILALSPSATARALGIRSERVADALDQGLLVARQSGVRKRIAVFGKGGIQEWFESWPVTRRKVPHGRLHD